MATLYEATRSYLSDVAFFFCGLGLAGCFVGVAINVVDWRNGGVLNTPEGRSRADKTDELTPLL